MITDGQKTAIFFGVFILFILLGIFVYYIVVFIIQKYEQTNCTRDDQCQKTQYCENRTCFFLEDTLVGVWSSSDTPLFLVQNSQIYTASYCPLNQGLIYCPLENFSFSQRSVAAPSMRSPTDNTTISNPIFNYDSNLRTLTLTTSSPNIQVPAEFKNMRKISESFLFSEPRSCGTNCFGKIILPN